MKKEHLKPQKKFNELYLVLAVAVLIIVITYFTNGPSAENAHKITEMIIDHHELSFATGGVIDVQKLEQIKTMDYLELKKDLNAGSDFCLYLEDGNGNVILAKGDSKLEGNGISCG